VTLPGQCARNHRRQIARQSTRPGLEAGPQVRQILAAEADTKTSQLELDGSTQRRSPQNTYLGTGNESEVHQALAELLCFGIPAIGAVGHTQATALSDGQMFER
jgi:hypothetical protein